jgi:hypothetical protein
MSPDLAYLVVLVVEQPDLSLILQYWTVLPARDTNHGGIIGLKTVVTFSFLRSRFNRSELFCRSSAVRYTTGTSGKSGLVVTTVIIHSKRERR